MIQKALFGAGCFWGVEEHFSKLNGVVSTEVGYSGGNSDNPTYKDVCKGDSNHAEVVNLYFNPEKISYDELLQIFWDNHNPTTLNRQGPDKGTQYRSSIFYKNDAQKNAAEAYIKQLTQAKAFEDPIVTALEPLEAYFAAEAYHQNFARLNPQHGYIRQQSAPKIKKVCTLFPKQVRSIVKDANAE